MANTRRLQVGVWFRRNTTDCQEMEQQKHDDNFSQEKVLHAGFLDYFSLLLILTLGLFLIVHASADRLHAGVHTEVQMQYVTGLKP